MGKGESTERRSYREGLEACQTNDVCVGSPQDCSRATSTLGEGETSGVTHSHQDSQDRERATLVGAEQLVRSHDVGTKLFHLHRSIHMPILPRKKQ